MWHIVPTAMVALAIAIFAPSALASETKQEQVVKQTIYKVFGKKHGADAVRVAHCESRFKTWARNGQYRGIFQMGSWERRTYSRGKYTTVYQQVKAAHRYFTAVGYSWRPWECKPWW